MEAIGEGEEVQEDTTKLFDLPPLSYEDQAQIVLDRFNRRYPDQQLYYPREESVLEGTEKRMVVDQQRLDDVLGTLYNTFKNNLYPYNQDLVRVPQDPRHMPSNLELLSKEHAMFLFTVCYYMRGGSKSVDSVRQLANMYENYPELFDAEYAKDQDPETIVKLLKMFGLGFQETVADEWVVNAQTLFEQWDSDPRNIYDGISDYETLVERIANKKDNHGFKGFQEKMVSMLTYYFMDVGIIPYFDFPPPIDLHLMRVSIANEIVRFEGYGEHEDLYSDELLALLRDHFHKFAVDNGLSVLRLADCTWLLSQSLCGNQPGNITLEPLGRKKRDGRGTFLLALPLSVDDHKQRTDTQKTCNSCPINRTCKYNVPGKYYTVQGRLIRRNKRLQFPQIVVDKSVRLSFEDDEN